MLESIMPDNPEIDRTIYRAYTSSPVYQALAEEQQRRYQALQAAFLAWEDARNAEQSYIAETYYRAGLGLRQELIDTLQLTGQSTA